MNPSFYTQLHHLSQLSQFYLWILCQPTYCAKCTLQFCAFTLLYSTSSSSNAVIQKARKKCRCFFKHLLMLHLLLQVFCSKHTLESSESWRQTCQNEHHQMMKSQYFLIGLVCYYISTKELWGESWRICSSLPTCEYSCLFYFKQPMNLGKDKHNWLNILTVYDTKDQKMKSKLPKIFIFKP